MRLILTALLALASLGSPAHAQEFPARPVKLVVPYPAGGASDTTARLIAQKVSATLGQPMVVENRVGAGGTIAFEHVAKSAPDGYTLLWAPGSMAVAPALQKVGYDVVRDYAPVAQIVAVQHVLVVPASSTIRSLDDLLAAARSRPGGMNYASAGPGSMPQLAMELLLSRTGTRITHVPYKGDTPALTDLLGGQVDVYFATLSGAVMQHVRDGRLRALAVSCATRSAALPEVPTVAEAGVRGYELASWFGIAAPRGTPAAIVEKLNARIVEAVAAPDVRERLVAAGTDPAPSSAPQFASLMAESSRTYEGIVKAAGIRLE
ncbi:MAG TPA: tripartite tricarboxylate transporter substrate binding protein [Burkholderiaceae bacterium]|nr:tripartite tricarboxylate transporter substrate binding protein [Burkholderiaceae bacterium]